MPHVVHTVFALADKVASMADKIMTKELIATNVTADTIQFGTASGQRICLGATCVTEAQLQAMLAAANQSAAPSGKASAGTPTTSSSTPPQITIAGNNPAHIIVGDTYQDLGATAKDNEGHELGVKTFLNGALVSDIVLDTSTTTTATIDYVATDTWGNTATATRWVIIEPPTPPNTTFS